MWRIILDNSKIVCKRCENEIEESSEFCNYCGALFLENTTCEVHSDKEAKGVCIICQLPYCENCGAESNNIFLCEAHGEYEIFEGMVRVYGSPDTLEVNFAKSCLEKESLHPMVYSRKATTISLGGPDYSLFRSGGDYRTHLINEIKLLVPSTEVLTAEKILRELKIIN